MHAFLTRLAAGVALGAAVGATADDHYDIAPYWQGGQLLAGGLSHTGAAVAPTVTVYGFEFGEDPSDPYNPSDPGVNQAAGTGNLPSGAAIGYNLLGSLLYWDGTGAVSWGTPSGGDTLTLLCGTTARTLTGSSGAQAGSLIQSVAADGSLHKHFTASLLAAGAASNVPGESGYIQPTAGIYAFQVELTMIPMTGGPTCASNAFWVVFSNGMSEAVHEAAIEALTAVPEPTTLALLAAAAAGLLRRRRRLVRGGAAVMLIDNYQ